MLQVAEEDGVGFRFWVGEHEMDPRPRFAIFGRGHVFYLAQLFQAGQVWLSGAAAQVIHVLGVDAVAFGRQFEILSQTLVQP